MVNVLEDFNDGDNSDWTAHGAEMSNFNAVTSPTFEGTHAAEIIGVTGSGQRFSKDVADFSGTSGYFEVYMRGDDSNWSSGDIKAGLGLEDSGRDLFAVRFRMLDDGRLGYNHGGGFVEALSSFSRNTWYKCIAKNIDTSSGTFDVEIVNTDTGSTVYTNSGLTFENGADTIRSIYAANTMSDGDTGYVDYYRGYDTPQQTLDTSSTFDTAIKARDVEVSASYDTAVALTDKSSSFGIDARVSEISTLTGTISLEETAVQGAEVICYNSTEQEFVGRTVTDSSTSGNYSFPDLKTDQRYFVAARYYDSNNNTRYAEAATVILKQ